MLMGPWAGSRCASLSIVSDRDSRGLTAVDMSGNERFGGAAVRGFSGFPVLVLVLVRGSGSNGQPAVSGILILLYYV